MGDLKTSKTSHMTEVYQQIHPLILNGGRKTDDKLPTEHQLAARFHVSHVVVRIDDIKKDRSFRTCLFCVLLSCNGVFSLLAIPELLAVVLFGRHGGFFCAFLFLHLPDQSLTGGQIPSDYHSATEPSAWRQTGFFH